MGTNVNQRPPALQRLIRKHPPCRDAAAADGLRPGIIDLTQLTGFAHLLEHLAVLAVTVLVADGQELPALLLRIQHLLRVRCGGSHGLLTHDMLTGLQGGHCQLTVGDIGRQHMDDLNLLFRQQLPVISVHPGIRCPILLGGLLGTFRNQVAERHHLCPAALMGKRREVFSFRDAAASNDADFEFFTHDVFLLTS